VTYGGSDIEVSLLLLRFFDEYVEEISCHMRHENDNVFSYIDKLLDNHSHSGHICPNGLFSDKHDDVARKLQELKNIIIGFVPQRDSNMMNSALLDIITCEKEIIAHCAIEDELFEPAVKRLEKTYMFQNKTEDDTTEATATQEKTPQQIETLSAREKEIIRLVACGMSNKEIAERLFLSVHTVTTHRRNLSQKLNIHSSAALTIFAIIHHLVDLDDIRSLNSNGI
ncbi:MAG: response regulator transcription factor, partial [Muribaculaceae bacterium]|nr:response regulator transcription factor [Muribaculaceae bacterium]